MIEDFWNELNEGEIHVRDSLQFELKSEFMINPNLKTNAYKQEVFLFIPSTLQINSQTYSKEQFYLDQTNLIRYRTPDFSLSEIIDPQNSLSPLNRIQTILNQTSQNFFFEVASDEIKLFGAIFRSSLREQVYKFVSSLMHAKPSEIDTFSPSISTLCFQITQISKKFRQLQDMAKSLHLHQLVHHFHYVDEFITYTIEEFLVILLKQLRYLEEKDSTLDKEIIPIILHEQKYRKEKHIGLQKPKGESLANESILYRQGLLNRFIMEALMLKHQRFSLEEKHTHILGATAAGIAMFFYMIIFFMWNTSGFIINSFPIVILVVFLYILKDRIKEGFKTLYYKQAYRWFPDYSTVISNPKNVKIGKLTENFAFINPEQLPPGFLNIRNRYFHEELQALQRHETIFQYKRELTLNPPKTSEIRRREITAIFRFNIHRFLQKVSNPFQSTLMLDSKTLEISDKLLPKIYHINIIIRNTFIQHDLTQKEEIKSFRVIVDKTGIKRVEQIKPPIS